MVRIAFRHCGLDSDEFVTQRADLVRPAEVDVLLGDATKAREMLGWKPTVTLEAMIAEMWTRIWPAIAPVWRCNAVASRILVTGACGFVGPHLIAALTAEFPAAEIRAAAADVTDMTSVSDEVRSFVPETCFHLAAVSAVPRANREPLGAWRVNLHGTLHLAAALQSHAPDCT